MALLTLTLALLAMTVTTTAIEEMPLDMALDSFDDQYRGCGPAMEAELLALNRSEFQNNSLFAKGWSEAVTMWRFRGSPVSPLSSSDQAIALTAYQVFYLCNAFNEDVSTAGRSPQEYRDKFHFKTLHFLLTNALATLRAAQKEQKCHCVIHVVPNYKFEANVGDVVRLGQFALSSLCDGDIESLQTATVFRVQTCHGVDISAFTDNPNTDEVLIPPFEKFKVTNVIDYGEKVQIHLDSIGTYSKYNCEWLTGGSGPRALAISEDSSWPPQRWQWPQGSSEPQSHEDICSQCNIYDYQDHQDTQSNEATKTTTATTATMAALATMASMWSLWPPLAL